MVKEFEEKVIGYDNVKHELEMVLDLLKNPAKYKKLGVNPETDGTLLTGRPGIGKSTLALQFCKASGRKIFILRKDKSDEAFVNEIRETFEKAAEEKSSIVFCEDIDKWANDARHNSYAQEYITLHSCIDNVKNKGVYVIATSNFTDMLPESLLRAGRLGRVIEMDFPEGEDAAKIVQHFLSKKKYVGDIDAREISRLLDGSSCSTLENVISDAGLIAGFKGKKAIEQEDIIESILRVVFDASENNQSEENPFISHVAYHEAAHAIISYLYNPGSVSLVGIRTVDGNPRGITSHTKPDGYFLSRKMMEERIVTILAGKAASEVVFGVTDTGANSDLHRAFSLAERIVDNYCAFGFDKFERERSSDALIIRKEQAVFSELEKHYQTAKSMLIENRAFLDEVAKAILSKKVILAKDMEGIYNNIYKAA